MEAVPFLIALLPAMTDAQLQKTYLPLTDRTGHHQQRKLPSVLRPKARIRLRRVLAGAFWNSQERAGAGQVGMSEKGDIPG